ncbi:anticodon-binding domain-containing protein [Glomus cerebriforme]|uniref:Anticodon-binding domain-containing protein n=1 Tax=Glomus cerebriforme TaxID=658196 RepID=A0A397T4J8_9GLOM|nr:anticodon-binding domain-containing protein [Glomus cerebriforme]
MQRAKSHTPARTPSDNVSQRVGNINNQNNNSNTVTTTSNNVSNVDNRESQQQKGLEWALGLSIRVKTLTEEEYEGQIYAYDPKTNCVVLQTPSMSTTPNSGGSQKYDFRILKISFLKEVVQIPNRKSSIDTNSNFAHSTTLTTNNSSPNGQNTNNGVFSTFVPSVGYVPMDRIQAREIQAVKETQAALARIGVGVTQKAQDIFDALSKTLPCRWAKESIIVLEEVRIDPPYDIDDCKAVPSASGSLTQVRKVLEGERKRLERLESGRK